MVLHYHFIYTDAHDNEFEFDDYEYKPSWEEIEAGWEEFFANTDTTEAQEEWEDSYLGGYYNDEWEFMRDYFEDEFYDFMHEYCEDAARDAFDDDDEVREQVDDALEYRRDPYSYYGVHRSDFV